jgi:hypothetical protein
MHIVQQNLSDGARYFAGKNIFLWIEDEFGSNIGHIVDVFFILSSRVPRQPVQTGPK